MFGGQAPHSLRGSLYWVRLLVHKQRVERFIEEPATKRPKEEAVCLCAVGLSAAAQWFCQGSL